MKTENLTIDRRYGKVLYETAKEQNNIEGIYEEIGVLREIYEDVPDLGKILSDDRLEPFERIDILHELDKDFGVTVQKFLRVIYEYGRMDEIPEIIDEYEHYYYDEKGVLVADVTTAIPLDEEQRNNVKAELIKHYDYEEVVLREKVKPEILGGMIVAANNKIIDQSIKKQLVEMYKELLK